MRVYFSGADVSTYHKFLLQIKIQSYSLSFERLNQRNSLETYGLEESSLYWVDHGMAGKARSVEETEDLLDKYFTFVQNRGDVIAGALEWDFLEPGPRAEVMAALKKKIPDKVWPVWDPGHETSKELLARAEEFGRVVVVGSNLKREDTASFALLASLRAQGLRLHIHQVRNPFHILRVQPESVSTMSWNAPTRYGELILPRGQDIHRVQPPHSEAELDLYVSRLAQSLGWVKGDFAEALRGGDMAAWSMIAVDTLLRYEELVTNSAQGQNGETGETEEEDPYNRGLEVRKHEPHSLDLLPGYIEKIEKEEVVDDRGVLVSTQAAHVHSSDTSLRMCDTCVLSASCPGFIPGNHCAYKIPVTLRSKEQLRSLMDTLLEIQTQRVLFMRFSEDVQGGAASKATGQEMDRLMNMMKTKNDLEMQRESLSINVQAGKSGGILSALFGQRAERANALPQGGYDREQTDMVIKQVLEPGNQ